ncbi:MAG: hypothetical protein JNM34_07470, partial [Chthonomonadaceae bacterium]|nr:hypothetical protein [Chthonomonadaceae bacterium]
KDGGAKFTAISGSHSDCHDLWVDPSDNKRMIESNDGGASVKVDGKSWTAQDFPTGQFYHVSTDDSRPYRILGAQQDNSTVRILSRGGSRGIGPTDWEGTAGGESGYVVAKPGQPNIVFGGSYGGDLTMLDHSSNVARSVDPWPDNPMGHGAIDLKHRFQWTFPIVFSPHDPGVLYTCSQVVHKSTNGGESWQVISPDLTRNDPRTLQSSGGPITQDNTSVEYYGTVFTLSESPIAKGTLWAGSDDGLVHLTRDGGKAWINVTPRGAPERGLCSMIDASPHKPGRAFLALDNHENDDYAPYVYRTDDYGKSWVKVTSGLTSFVRVVREDPVRENMLYCGTEAGVSVSFDGGQNWQPLQFNLPVTPIHDLTVKDDDLILATHGRGFWVYDNLESLRQLKQGLSPKSAFLFKPKTLLRGGGGGGGRGRGTPPPAGTQFGENPPMGLVVDLYLPNKVDKVEGSVKDGKGFQVASFSFSSPRAGFNRASASGFRYPGIRSFPGMITWATRSGSLPAPPGDYFVEIQVGTEKLTQRFHYGRNPQTNSSEDDLKEQFALASKIVARTNEANDAVVIIRDIRKKAKDAAAAKPELKDAVDQLDQKLTPIEETIYQTKSKAGQDPLNYPIRLNDKLGGVLGVVLSGDWRPTKQSYEVFNLLSRELELPLTKLAACIKDDLAALNAKLEALGLKAIVPVQPNGEGGQGR